MTMTDPIADMLARLRNAARASHATLEMPSSKMKVSIADILKEEGYIADYVVSDAEVGKTLSITLKYVGDDSKPSIAGMKRVSRPGLRIYANSKELPRVLGGMGTAIISTSSGVMTQREASRRKLGGEVLAFVW